MVRAMSWESGSKESQYASCFYNVNWFAFFWLVYANIIDTHPHTRADFSLHVMEWRYFLHKILLEVKVLCGRCSTYFASS